MKTTPDFEWLDSFELGVDVLGGFVVDVVTELSVELAVDDVKVLVMLRCTPTLKHVLDGYIIISFYILQRRSSCIHLT